MAIVTGMFLLFNILRPRQNGRHSRDYIVKCIFLNKNVYISTKISLEFFPKGPISKSPALVHIMAWRRPGDKPLSEPMMVSLRLHICATRRQWFSKTRNTLSYPCLYTKSLADREHALSPLVRRMSFPCEDVYAFQLILLRNRPQRPGLRPCRIISFTLVLAPFSSSSKSGSIAAFTISSWKLKAAIPWPVSIFTAK